MFKSTFNLGTYFCHTQFIFLGGPNVTEIMGNISFIHLKTTNKSTLERSVTQVKYFIQIKWKGLNEGFARSYRKPSEIVIGDE